MGYNQLAANQTVTFTNLQDAVTLGIFTLKSAITSTLECITKTDANTYVNIDTSYTPYANKSSNQLVVKGDLQPNGYDYYTADEYDCDTCTLQRSSIVVGFATGVSVTLTKYYTRQDYEPFVYRIIDVTSSSTPVAILQKPQYNTCTQACGGRPQPN